MRALILVFLAAAGLAHLSPAYAKGGDWTTCSPAGRVPDVDACSRIIARGHGETSIGRARAYAYRAAARNVSAQYELAVADCDEALRLDPKSFYALLFRGSAWLGMEKYDRAIADLTQAIARAPDAASRSTTYSARAGARRESGDLDGAIQDATHAIALSPKNGAAFWSRGQSWRAKGELDRAIADLTRGIGVYSDFLDPFVLRGLVYEQKGEPAQAKRDYRTALGKRPGYVSSKRLLETARIRLALLSEPAKPPTPSPPPSAPVELPAPNAAPAPQHAAPADQGRRIALVIGNGAYPGRIALPNPPNDARGVASALRDMGFEVLEGINLDRAGLDGMVHQFLLKASAARTALLFYAGHGVQIDGRNYLVPVDAKVTPGDNLTTDMTALDTILSALDDQIRTNIVILDACRDDPLAAAQIAAASGARSLAVRSGLAAPADLGKGATVGAGTLLAFATAPGQVALDGSGANSPFSKALLRHLPTPGLEVQQMLTRVRAEVVAATGGKQVPWSNSSLLGEVYLAGRP